MKEIVFFAIMLVTALGYGCNAMNHKHVGHGQRNGTIVKLADEGFWFKTHEVEIIRGGLNGASGGFGTKPFYATVRTEADMAVLQKAFEEQKEVVLTYDEYWWTPVDSECGGENEHCAYVSGIEVK